MGASEQSTPGLPPAAGLTSATGNAAGNAPGSGGLRLDKRRLLVIGALGALTLWLLVSLSGGRSALDAVAQADWRLIGLAVLVHYASFAVRGHRWQRLLIMLGHRLAYLYTTTLLLAGWFVSALLPARAGDLLRIGMLRLDDRHAPVPVAVGLSSIVLERVLDILAILVLGAGFGFFLLRASLPPWLLTAYATGIVLLVGFGLALLLAPPLLEWLRRRSAHRFWQLGMGFLGQVVESLRVLFRQPAAALLVSVESLVIWLCDALVVWLVMLSFHVAAPFAVAAFVALTVDVLAAVPLTPGGVGQIDAAYAALLALVPLAQAGGAPPIGPVVLVVRLITFWSFLALSGLVTLLAGFGRLLPGALAIQLSGEDAPPAVPLTGEDAPPGAARPVPTTAPAER